MVKSNEASANGSSKRLVTHTLQASWSESGDGRVGGLVWWDGWAGGVLAVCVGVVCWRLLVAGAEHVS